MMNRKGEVSLLGPYPSLLPVAFLCFGRAADLYIWRAVVILVYIYNPSSRCFANETQILLSIVYTCRFLVSPSLGGPG